MKPFLFSIAIVAITYIANPQNTFPSTDEAGLVQRLPIRSFAENKINNQRLII